MFSYDIKVIGSNQSTKMGILFQIKINSITQQYFQRIIWVKDSTLQDIHNDLVNENTWLDLPNYPKPGLFSQIINNLYRAKENQLHEREKLLNDYFDKIKMISPPYIRSLYKLCKFQFDAIREAELNKESHNYIQTKKDIFALYTKIKKLQKGLFENTYRIKKDRNQFILHIYKLPKIQESQIQIKNYIQIHSQITDFTYFTKIESIFTIRKNKKNQQQGIMKSLFGEKNKQQIDIQVDDPYLIMGLSEDGQYDYLCSIEEDFGISMKLEIEKRKKNQEYFLREEIIEIFQSLLSALDIIHQFDQIHNHVQLNNIFYDKKSVKLSGILEPVNVFRTKYNYEYLIGKSKKAFYNVYAYQPPENKNCDNLYNQNRQSMCKGDVWQLGICMICICTLSQPKDLTEIFDLKSKQLETLIEQINNLYGEGISSILALMTERDNIKRPEASELLSNVFSTELVSIKLEIFSQIQSRKQNKIYKIQSVSQLKSINFEISQQLQNCNYLSLNFSLIQQKLKLECIFSFPPEESKEILEFIQQFQNVIECINIDVSDQMDFTTDLINNLLKGLTKLVSLQRLNLNFRGLAIDGTCLKCLEELLELPLFKKLTLDIKKCQNIEAGNLKQLLSFIGQSNKQISIYTDLMVNLEKCTLKIIQEE